MGQGAQRRVRAEPNVAGSRWLTPEPRRGCPHPSGVDIGVIHGRVRVHQTALIVVA
jgi:hypothetical protein